MAIEWSSPWGASKPKPAKRMITQALNNMPTTWGVNFGGTPLTIDRRLPYNLALGALGIGKAQGQAQPQTNGTADLMNMLGLGMMGLSSLFGGGSSEGGGILPYIFGGDDSGSGSGSGSTSGSVSEEGMSSGLLNAAMSFFNS